MAGYAVAVLKSVQRKRTGGVALFIEPLKVVAVAVAVCAVFKYSRVERHQVGAVLVHKVGAEAHKTNALALVLYVLYIADYAVYHIVTHFFVYKLFPVVKRAYKLFAFFGQTGKSAVTAHFLVQLCARSVHSAYQLLGL